MWAFFDFGLLMPALVPAAVKDREDVLAWTNGGEYELQVRGRLREHLQYFMDTYMESGTFNPEIQATPNKDYNYRFYTTREAYAEGIKQAALAMDYEKFKVTADRFSWNKVYHQVLNSIWATACKLNEPGGFYGPRSAENPDGYDTRNGSSYWGGGSESWYDKRHSTLSGRRIGESFGVADDEENPMAWFDDRGEDESVTYFSEDEKDMWAIIEALDEVDIPMSEWWEYTSPREFSLLKSYLRNHFSNKVLKKMTKKNGMQAEVFISEYNDS